MDEDRFPLEDLAAQVRRYFVQNAGGYSLDPAAVDAHYILNWGGFVNASFRISDGRTDYHLKLADDEDVQDCLERWRQLNQRLTRDYHAPRMIDWVDLPGTPFAGPLFEYIPGQPADLTRQPEILYSVLNMLARLHADRELAGELESFLGPPSSCADYFISVYIDRFDEDLLVVAPELPPFVSLSTLDWMMGETRELEALARETPAFDRPANAATHGDLWANNILVGESGKWNIIDWDDLALGDPALDYSILLGPLWLADRLAQDEMVGLLPDDSLLRERFAVCQRALVLDQVIDTLADWVESGFAPQHQNEVRVEKERSHKSALALYYRLFGE